MYPVESIIERTLDPCYTSLSDSDSLLNIAKTKLVHFIIMQSYRSSTRCLHQGRTKAGTLLDIISCQQISHSIKMRTNLDARPGSAPDAELLVKLLSNFSVVGEFPRTVNASYHHSFLLGLLLFTVSYLTSQPSSMLSTRATLIRNTRLIWGVRLLHSSPLVKMPIQVTFIPIWVVGCVGFMSKYVKVRFKGNWLKRCFRFLSWYESLWLFFLLCGRQPGYRYSDLFPLTTKILSECDLHVHDTCLACCGWRIMGSLIKAGPLVPVY